jgi:mannose-1-phosphate guanylyltransferase/phosphomannomutase
MKAVILCAGMGSRLGTLTKDVPKPMLPLNGKPLLAYTIGHLMKFGIFDIAINTHYFAEQITNCFKNGYSFGARLHYSYEKELLGTAGALIKLRPWLAKEENCLVLYGDILTDQDISLLIDKHRNESSFATLLLHKRQRSNSIVKMNDDGRITCFKERPSERERAQLLRNGDNVWVNSGIQILSREALNYIGHIDAFDLPRDVYCKCVAGRQVFGLPLTGNRIAIDSPDRYREAEQAILQGKYNFE